MWIILNLFQIVLAVPNLHIYIITRNGQVTQKLLILTTLFQFITSVGQKVHLRTYFLVWLCMGLKHYSHSVTSIYAQNGAMLSFVVQFCISKMMKLFLFSEMEITIPRIEYLLSKDRYIIAYIHKCFQWEEIQQSCQHFLQGRVLMGYKLTSYVFQSLI